MAFRTFGSWSARLPTSATEQPTTLERRTLTALAELTDNGLFEIIATSVLRIAEPLCAGLSHPGVNPAGKTKKSPVDGVCYAPGDPDHLIVVHHTIAVAQKSKWLTDPATVRRRSGKTPPTPGDVIKTIDLVAARRRRNPALRALLILTTNREIEEDLMSEVTAYGAERQLAVDFWSGARIAQVLDTDPNGQWIRRKRLGIAQERLSTDLLASLSEVSAGRFSAGDDPTKRVARRLDEALLVDTRRLAFVVAPSGFGKTVACHRALAAHVAGGGFGLVLAHDHVERSASLEQALHAALQDIEPSLSATESVLGLASEDRPLLVLVEDISRSREPGRLIDKLMLWSAPAQTAPGASSGRVRILCPIWPHLLSLASPGLEREREGALFRPPALTESEGRQAVERAARVDGAPLSKARAGAIARALGDDPLLIGLNRDWDTPDPTAVIGRYVEVSANRTCGGSATRAIALTRAFLRLGREMMVRRVLTPSWTEVLAWSLDPDVVQSLERLIDAGDLLRLEGAADGPLRFRHDRVRAWMLARAALALLEAGELDDDLVAEPAYAEIIAGLLQLIPPRSSLIERITNLNPLALFQALGMVGASSDPSAGIIAAAAAEWLSRPEAQGPGLRHLRWEAMVALEPAQGDYIPSLVDAFPAPNAAAQLAKLKNGDIEGGVAVCERWGLNAAANWLPRAWEIASDAWGDGLVAALATALDQSEAGSPRRRGLLILAGIAGALSLRPCLSRAWDEAGDRMAFLRDYLWAFARCTTPEQAAADLDPVCGLWATLPAPKHYEPDRRGATVYNLASDEVRFAVNRLPPMGALDYFFARARSPDLDWPIQHMLQDVDDPKVVLFIVDVLAEARRRSLDSYTTSGLRSMHWRYQSDPDWAPMSAESRAALLAAWRDTGADPARRIAAFDWWSSSRDSRDLPILRALQDDRDLSDRAFSKRLERGDVSAHQELVSRLQGPDRTRWLYSLHYAWSPLLAAAFEALLVELGERSEAFGLPEGEVPYVLAEVFLRMPRADAQRLLLSHWPVLAQSPRFIQIALYVGTPELYRRVAAIVDRHDNPATLFDMFTSTWGIRTNDNVGVTREDQILGIAPYLKFLEPHEINQLADCCDERGWFATRRRLLDPLITDSHVDRTVDDLLKSFEEWTERGFPIESALDRALGAGLTRQDIVGALSRWLPDAPSNRALAVAAQTICHVGGRSDVRLLKTWPGTDHDAMKAALRDTRFAVARRTF